MDNSDSEEVSEIPTAELILTADGLRLFRIRRTVMEMLRDRGYEVPDAEFRQSQAQFGATFGTAPYRHTLNFCTSKRSNPDDRVLVIFSELETGKNKVGVTTMKESAAAMKSGGAKRAILVVQKPLTPFAKQFLDQMDKKYRVDVFEEAELLVNIMDSVFVPKHQVLLPAEKDALMKELLIPEGKEEQLPKLQRTDPVARYLGLETGQIVKIFRPGKSAADDQQPSTSYRLVT